MVKIKIENTGDSTVTINLKALNEKEIPVAGKKFCTLTEEELAYVMNTSKIFEVGSLRVMKLDELSEDIDKDALQSPNALSDEDIINLLKKPQKQVEIALETVTSVSVVKRILEKANELDKSVKIVGVIEAKLESLLS